MWSIMIALFAGLSASRLRFLPEVFFETVSKGSFWALLTLLFSMGANIGVNPTLMAGLGPMGIRAATIASLSVVGSVMTVWVMDRVLRRSRKAIYSFNGNLHKNESDGSGASLTGWILLAVILGVAAGARLIPQSFAGWLESLGVWSLNLVLFDVGVGMGRTGVINQVRQVGLAVVAVPVLVAVGTLAGAILASALLQMPASETLAVGAGFGWYSLSGVLISRLGSADLGALAFMANVFRELTAIILIPVLARKTGYLTSIAPGGATTMDTTLPLIVRATGGEMTVIAVMNGVMLSSMVPLLVPLFMRI